MGGAMAENGPIAFAFGLLHGFGFASALNQVGLPQNAIPVALLFFNLGVEAGQLLFIAAVVVAIAFGHKLTRSFALSLPTWAWRVPPYAIGSVAAFGWSSASLRSHNENRQQTDFSCRDMKRALTFAALWPKRPPDWPCWLCRRLSGGSCSARS